MHSLIKHLKSDKADEEPHQPQSDAPVKRSRAPAKPPSNDPNIPKKRLHLNQICLYERRLPGRAYVSAHVNRLQHGFYRSDVLHGAAINHVYFVSVRFVFHPHDPESHRFRSAEIQVSLHGEDPSSGSHRRSGRSQPRILKHAPELMFGAVSPENLQWNFSLSTSLGVSPASPVGAYIIPQASVQSSYKVFHMMSIQGSVRSRQDRSGQTIEDSKAVWTLSENVLQKSGLPREFDFVMLVQKPKDVKNIYMTVNVDTSVATWYGAYPQWYNNLSEYVPSQNFAVSFEHDVGQRFLPSHPGLGYNFADLIHSLDQVQIKESSTRTKLTGGHLRKTRSMSPTVHLLAPSGVLGPRVNINHGYRTRASEKDGTGHLSILMFDLLSTTDFLEALIHGVFRIRPRTLWKQDDIHQYDAESHRYA
ncbi:hypothetical protein GGP41_004427 [Bipolaris sorokiniana]|uniref:Uncharacterized protein n=1 Tax=Cochliobolus sativus TaxID=45130 RepID=A0A8H5ZMJ7_COCSA|nr:hypothetical protein GGP41_004427 [Bipolaris sorokiniana]